ncbi:Uncharacterised protein [Weissella viridescens]|uniref:Uncharacterized protein n=1 Tax=Weissella viridescens TaxID=1629 RepID=A0A380P1Q9_WEIVI|nr:Uncharacterised protein [Weissella viridescens]
MVKLYYDCFLAITLAFMFFNPETRVSLTVGLVFLAIMAGVYFTKFAKNDHN